MSRRRRRVKIKSSSRLFAFILFNLLLLASCVAAHYQPRASGPDGLAPPPSPALNEPANPMLNPVPRAPGGPFELKSDQTQATAGPTGGHPQTSHHQLEAAPFADEGPDGHQQHNNQQQQPPRDTASAWTPTSIPSIAGLCASLPGAGARQLRLCRLVGHSANADEAVAQGAAKGLAECRQQFRSERWNCTHVGGDHHLLTGKLAQSVGSREGGFVQAIAAAGIVHSIATACSTGSLTDCACDKTRVGPIRQRDQHWKWGGCSNNIRHGMMYAKHLVELLDAVHEHQHRHHMQRSLGSQQRAQAGQPQQSLASRCHQLERRSAGRPPGEPNFCQKNQNISQTTHIQLIKSLLAKNSLERHQDFRLAVNAHNNRVGRMAVARNMEVKCRCHGLSGSCGLKTCWLKLPDFQQVGAHLRRKYEASVHLPTAINVNKLIPMMDRAEISAILQQQPQPAAEASESSNSLMAAVSSSAPAAPEFAAWAGEPPARLNYYERHKQLEQQLRPAGRLAAPQPPAQPPPPGPANASTSLYLHGDEVPVQIAPMSQPQYQALLREMELCNSSRAHRLAARDLHNQSEPGGLALAHLCQRQLLPAGRKSANSLAHEPAGRPQRASAAGLAQLSHLLQWGSRDELVHLHKSPDYCEADLRHGYAGVQARLCSSDPQAPDSCDKLCCGRGFERRETELRYNCDCKFQYCCKIHCNVCQKSLVEYVCK